MAIPKNYLLTGSVVLLAVLAVTLKYWDYLANPWTRDGQVRAEVIQITPRISGPIVQLPIQDNQFVSSGDLLFVVDPRTFQANLEQAQAQYDKTGDSYLGQEQLRCLAPRLILPKLAPTLAPAETPMPASGKPAPTSSRPSWISNLPRSEPLWMVMSPT